MGHGQTSAKAEGVGDIESELEVYWVNCPEWATSI